MPDTTVAGAVRAAAPTAVTAARIPLGAWALLAAVEHQPVLAATLITLGGVSDGIDGWVARRLGVASSFGALFDCFCDFLCFVVAPWMLVRTLLSGDRSTWGEIVLLLPLVTAAIRYARNGLIISRATAEVRALPGLATVFFAFLPVTAVFLQADTWIPTRVFDWALLGMVALFSALMVVPIDYPKLSSVRGAPAACIVLLACMPFAATKLLAGTMLSIGLLYLVAGPLLVRERSGRL
jgi:CDP-diacylglycerol--serine O-phosphatidyltransferase